jgi:hypothetical protein
MLAGKQARSALLRKRRTRPADTVGISSRFLSKAKRTATGAALEETSPETVRVGIVGAMATRHELPCFSRLVAAISPSAGGADEQAMKRLRAFVDVTQLPTCHCSVTEWHPVIDGASCAAASVPHGDFALLAGNCHSSRLETCKVRLARHATSASDPSHCLVLAKQGIVTPRSIRVFLEQGQRDTALALLAQLPRSADRRELTHAVARTYMDDIRGFVVQFTANQVGSRDEAITVWTYEALERGVAADVIASVLRVANLLPSPAALAALAAASRCSDFVELCKLVDEETLRYLLVRLGFLSADRESKNETTRCACCRAIVSQPASTACLECSTHFVTTPPMQPDSRSWRCGQCSARCDSTEEECDVCASPRCERCGLCGSVKTSCFCRSCNTFPGEIRSLLASWSGYSFDDQQVRVCASPGCGHAAPGAFCRRCGRFDAHADANEILQIACAAVGTRRWDLRPCVRGIALLKSRGATPPEGDEGSDLGRYLVSRLSDLAANDDIPAAALNVAVDVTEFMNHKGKDRIGFNRLLRLRELRTSHVPTPEEKDALRLTYLVKMTFPRDILCGASTTMVSEGDPVPRRLESDLAERQPATRLVWLS